MHVHMCLLKSSVQELVMRPIRGKTPGRDSPQGGWFVPSVYAVEKGDHKDAGTRMVSTIHFI